MDEIFECYFGRVFSQMHCDFLLYRHNRREMSDYFQNVITGCCQAGKCDVQRGCRLAVEACLRHHSASKRNNGAVCLQRKHHHILYVAAKIAFDLRLEDDRLVARLLDDIFSCEGTFEKLFVGAVFGTTAAALMVSWRSDFDSSEENLLALDYFLDHATKANLKYIFRCKYVRVVDYPMASFDYLSPVHTLSELFNPDVLEILLKYGARIPADDNGNVPAIKHIVGRLYRYFDKGWEFTPEIAQDPVKCLRLLFRAVPLARLPRRDDSSKEKLRESLKADVFIPLFQCALDPPELKHLCRCAVRKALNANWQLPRGIYKLNVPKSIQEYLSLQRD